MQIARQIDKHSFTGLHIPHQLKMRKIQSDRLGCQHPIGSLRRHSATKYERTYPIRITKSYNALPHDQGNDRVAAADTLKDARKRTKKITRR